MEQQTPPTAVTVSASASASQPTDAPPQPPQPQPTPAPQPLSSLATPSSSTPNPNPNPNPTTNQIPNSKPSSTSTSSLPPHSLPSPSQPPPAPRPSSTFSRTLPQHQQHQQPHYPHFSSLPSSSSSASSSASPSISPPQPRGGVAIGVPAHHANTSPQPTPFSSSFGQHFGGLGRSPVHAPESAPNSNVSQARPTIQGVQGMGMLGSLGSSSSQIRPGGIPAHHQQRPVQSSLRPSSSPTNQPSISQNLQGHGLLRISSVGSPGSPSPNTSQSMQSINQPWLSSGSQGKPPLPSPSNRLQVNSQMQQRAHLPQQPQHHPVPAASQQQHISSLQPQQPSPSNQLQEHYGQQFAPSRVQQSVPHQPQITRVQGSGNQKPSSLAMLQPNTVQSGPQNRTAIVETDESCNRILTKRSVQELVSQVDPLEKLDPEVEDILVDIAEDFVDSITTFGCSLAKHRKSNTLEAKDILLHLERNWNMTLPGFGGDEIKSYRKLVTNDIHKERLAAIKKSIVATETATKISSGQAAGSVKGNLAKTPANALAPQT
ncbi:transcription initiation factor TFIID subunit 12 isoform X1 [Juglans microcarpa x Juglans regia]|uniref:transcription initiation factor TFIID subunit 12 isoform X1 n=1 Tax=Juglans microcarpa x Juglans regia TaxID=2249226 RepID=UPI001B7D954F|nr:transcription initiation factor TFIID subunit 12 isoform X1 [Juglans microcarpa x Juglans regia]